MSFSRVFPIVVLALAADSFAQDGANALTPAEQAGGWKLLFDGRAAPGLQGLQKREFLKAGWEIKDGALVLPKSVRESGNKTGGDLLTTETYEDFEFKFDFKLTAAARSGILYFARKGDGLKPVGHEYQIIDDVHHVEGIKGGAVCRTGALYGVLPPAENKQFHSDGWNTAAILVRGNHVEHRLNGDVVLEYECGSPALKQAAQTNNAKVHGSFGTKIKSSLAILDKGEEVAFRNLKIRVANAAAPAASPPAAPAATPAPAKPASKLPPPPPPPVLNP